MLFENFKILANFFISAQNKLLASWMFVADITSFLCNQAESTETKLGNGNVKKFICSKKANTFRIACQQENNDALAMHCRPHKHKLFENNLNCKVNCSLEPLLDNEEALFLEKDLCEVIESSAKRNNCHSNKSFDQQDVFSTCDKKVVTNELLDLSDSLDAAMLSYKTPKKMKSSDCDEKNIKTANAALCGHNIKFSTPINHTEDQKNDQNKLPLASTIRKRLSMSIIFVFHSIIIIFH